MAVSTAALRHRDFRFLIGARFFSLTSHQMLVIALSQYVYEITHAPLSLGLMGLAFFLPKMFLTLPAGHTADRYDRRSVILCARLAQFSVVCVLAYYIWLGGASPPVLYSLILLLASTYAFDGPAAQSIVPDLVPAEDLTNAVTFNAATLQFAFILGPALGGFLYGLFGAAAPVVALVAAGRLIALLLTLGLRARGSRHDGSPLSFEMAVAGLKYVFQNRIILGTISLDLFAVLLGGAVGLMPVFANDILKVGPEGLGWLRAGPFMGAVLTSIAFTMLPPLKRAGSALLVCVAIFGLGTLVFALSRDFLFSMMCLIVMGAADMVSVIIRGVLVQTRTPPEMRGRVSAVNLVFIGASNELGEFESGLTAHWFGAVPAVILGGAGTLAVVGLWAWLFPEIRRLKTLEND